LGVQQTAENKDKGEKTKSHSNMMTEEDSYQLSVISFQFPASRLRRPELITDN
jgi:hypothetical protein